MTPALFGAALEVALNRYLRREPAAVARCARLASKRVRIELSGFDWRFDLVFDAAGVVVQTDAAETPEVSVRGPLPSLIRLVLRNSGIALPEGIDVKGDAELLQALRRMLADVGFDPEEIAAGFLGGAAAHRLGAALRGLFGWGRRSADTLALDAAEYLREETRDLARAADVDDWAAEVEALRERADRFEVRLRKIEARNAAAAEGARR